MVNKGMTARQWFEQISVAFLGTVLGIIVTVGVTFWQERKAQNDMADKITKITLYNINLRITGIEDHLASLGEQKESYDSLMKYMPDHLGELHTDSLNKYYSEVNNIHFGMYDTKTEQIFGSSFQVWQAFDDVKVISRLSNCYSIIDFSEQQFALVNKYMIDASNELYGKLNNQPVDKITEVRYFLSQPQTTIAMSMIEEILPSLIQINKVAHQLNLQNIQAMGYSENELRQLGRLDMTNP